jgi:hypothetical protein
LSYHPLYGIIFFFICLFVAYIFGKKSLLKNNKKLNKKESNVYSRELISPDAPWLDKNENSD